METKIESLETCKETFPNEYRKNEGVSIFMPSIKAQGSLSQGIITCLKEIKPD
jgi:hypothetical protein